MQLYGVQPSGSDGKVQRAGNWLTVQLGILAGLAMLAGVAFVFASLATWNVADPSLSNANGRLPQNAGGFIGSSIADLMIQFTGLASVVALVPPAVWAWLKISRRPIRRWRARALAWLPAVVFVAAALACLPRPEAWPLPTGLGGVSGDLVLKLPGLVTGGFPHGVLAVALGLLLTLIALPLVLFAAGLIWRGAPAGHVAYDADTGEIVEEDDDSALAFGALAHWYLMMKARFRRHGAARPAEAPARRRPSLIARLRDRVAALLAPADDGLEVFDRDAEAVRPAGARDDDWLPDDGDGDWLRAPDLAPGYGESVHDPFGDEAQGELLPGDIGPAAPSHSDASAAAGRVRPAPARPRPGARLAREAQPSLLADDRFELPQVGLLAEPRRLGSDPSVSTEALEQNARLLEGVLEDFGVKGEIINVRPGPVVTLYELEPAPGIKSSRVIGLADDIARSMSAIACRVAVVPGRNAIGIELPNARRETVYLRELLASRDYETTKGRLSLILGKTIGGEPVIADLAKMPHLLIAGTTGSGKSVAINTMILSLLYRLTPDEVRLIMIDPKMLELSVYDGIPHLLHPVVTDPKKAVVALKWTVREMEDRYRRMSKLGVRNIDGFNARIEQARSKGEVLTRTVQTGYDRETGEAIYETETLDLATMPYIVVVIDEMADLMMVAGKDIEGAVQRLAQMARAAGIHVIMATQRPSVDVITGTIKANFPTRISYQVTSKIDSRTILGEQGAEQLLGMGDMLYMAGGGRIQRVHGPFVSDEEVEKVVAHLKTQGVPEYLDTVTQEDEEDDGPASPGGGAAELLAQSNDLYDQAVAVVLRDRKVSTSYVQRRLGIGYNRAASLIERMEKEGLISPPNHAGKRDILVPAEDETI
ncbi:MAG: DNA translocase FtsK [Alphaproteobacteria bacterium]|nr:MAG: DNA translocase FtsK [Alphaproteobacteria bacterium]